MTVTGSAVSAVVPGFGRYHVRKNTRHSMSAREGQ